MPEADYREELRRWDHLIAELSSQRATAVGLAAIGRWADNERRSQVHLQLRTWARHVRSELEPGSERYRFADTIETAFHARDPHAPGLFRFTVRFFAWLVNAGYAFALSHSTSTEVPLHFALTPAGEALIANGHDHPLLDGAIERTVERCPGLPAEVITTLVDARECLERSLTRPAIILMGLAYEYANDQIVAFLAASEAHAGAVKYDPEANASLNERQLRAWVESLKYSVSSLKDARSAALDAIGFSSELRRRRNDGAHTNQTFPTNDRVECEELFTESLRYLPRLWNIRELPIGKK